MKKLNSLFIILLGLFLFPCKTFAQKEIVVDNTNIGNYFLIFSSQIFGYNKTLWELFSYPDDDTTMTISGSFTSPIITAKKKHDNKEIMNLTVVFKWAQIGDYYISYIKASSPFTSTTSEASCYGWDTDSRNYGRCMGIFYQAHKLMFSDHADLVEKELQRREEEKKRAAEEQKRAEEEKKRLEYEEQIKKQKEEMLRAEEEEKRRLAEEEKKKKQEEEYRKICKEKINEIFSSTKTKMTSIEGGPFILGNEKDPFYNIKLFDFDMLSTEVTQELYELVMNENPSVIKEKHYPVVNVNFSDALKFCNRLSNIMGLSECYSIKNNVLICDFEADGFRLPTLEEWDFVAKGGGKKEEIPIIDREWYNANSKGSIHDVATKKSNILEIYDILGNVSEWCWDTATSSFASSTLKDNPYAHDIGLNKLNSNCKYKGTSYAGREGLMHEYGELSLQDSSDKVGFRICCISESGTKKKALAKLGYRKPLQNMVTVEGDIFMMGGRNKIGDALPEHSVSVSSFQIGTTEVTQLLYTAIMGNNPSSFHTKGDNKPVNQVSFYDAIVFCNRLSIHEGLTPCYAINGSTNPEEWGAIPLENNNLWNSVSCNWDANGYRLPTEAEWEFAAQGGNKSRGYKYSGSNNISEIAWYGLYDENGTFEGTAHRIETVNDIMLYDVNTKNSNELGIYDMTGNVCELCWDWYDKNYYETLDSSVSNPKGPDSFSSTSNKVCKGGSILTLSEVGLEVFTRSESDFKAFDIGFRICRKFDQSIPVSENKTNSDKKESSNTNTTKKEKSEKNKGKAKESLKKGWEKIKDIF